MAKINIAIDRSVVFKSDTKTYHLSPGDTCKLTYDDSGLDRLNNVFAKTNFIRGLNYL